MKKKNLLKKFFGKIKWHVRTWINKKIMLWKNVLTKPKPEGVSWLDFHYIYSRDSRYQPLVFPDDIVINRKGAASIMDSRNKLEALGMPEDLTGKTILDIGCAEGFFVTQSVLRGADRGIGCDLLNSRLRLAHTVAKAWNIQNKTKFQQLPLYDIPEEFASDIVICLAVIHHLHDGSHDTWRIINNAEKYSKEYQNMLKGVAAVSKLTKEVTYWEFAYEYEGDKPQYVDYEKLGRILESEGFYQKVEFIGLAMETDIKDRAIYHAFK